MLVKVNGMVVADAKYNSVTIYQGRSVCEEQIMDVVLSGWGVDDLIQTKVTFKCEKVLIDLGIGV